MTSAKRYLLIALSFAVAVTVFAAFGPRAVHAITATLVQVVNTSANPVPVQQQGPVTIGNAAVPVIGAVNANVTNGSLPVTVNSNVPVIDPARNVVHLSAYLNMTDGGLVGAYAWANYHGNQYAVPAGKRLVVNSISFRGETPSGVGISPYVGSWDPNWGFNVQLDAKLVCAGCQGGNVVWHSDVYSANSTAPMYIEPGQDVYLYMNRASNSGVVAGWAYIQGYLVDAQ